MLPKMTKNLFRDKVKQVSSKSFNFKTFLMGVFFVGTASMAGVTMPTALEVDNLIKEQKQASFILKPSVEGLILAGHSSHGSHGSHGSHASHSSHASSSYNY